MKEEDGVSPTTVSIEVFACTEGQLGTNEGDAVGLCDAVTELVDETVLVLDEVEDGEGDNVPELVLDPVRLEVDEAVAVLLVDNDTELLPDMVAVRVSDKVTLSLEETVFVTELDGDAVLEKVVETVTVLEVVHVALKDGVFDRLEV